LGIDPALGLSTGEVAKQQAQYGLNSIQSIRPRPAWRLLVDQFASVVIALLAAAALVAWVSSDMIEAIAIVVVLLINALVGFITEWQAGRALEALRRQTRMTTRVRRDGIEITVDAEDLVPGDIIILNAGDSVPADARLLECYCLQTEESALTGESTPVDKAIEEVSEAAPLSERSPMVYLGTAIVAGRGVAIVVDTGAQTELGRVGRLVATPLEIRLAQLGRRLVYIALAIAFVVMVAGWLRGDGLWTIMIASLALAAYLWALRMYGPGAQARTVALFALIGAQLGHMFNCRSRTRSALDGIFRNPFIWAATIIVVLLQFLAIYFSPLATVLGTARLDEIDWMVIGFCVVAPVIVVEITKAATKRSVSLMEAKSL